MEWHRGHKMKNTTRKHINMKLWMWSSHDELFLAQKYFFTVSMNKMELNFNLRRRRGSRINGFYYFGYENYLDYWLFIKSYEF